MKIVNLVLASILVLGTILFDVCEARADDLEQLVAEARQVVLDFAADPDMGWFRENVGQAKAMLIFPRVIRAGFVFGGAGGSGVLLARDPQTGAWSYPAFYTLGSASFGAQIGGSASQVIFLIMSQKALDSLLATSVKLGADLEVAAGPVGQGAKAMTVDILAFSRTKGLYGGATVDGAVIATRDEWNARYYGKPVRPIEILVQRTVSRPDADPLREAVARISGSVPVAATPTTGPQ
jgi:lipid-binding SYLF domain-containing protein